MFELAEKIRGLRINIKAEAVVEDLIMNGYDPDHIFIEYRTSHKKNWDNDILSCDFNGQDLIIRLSRDGLFHTLPEYLFLLNAEELADQKESVKEFNRQQETNTHLFFHPIENEIFKQLVELENQENYLLSVLESSTIRELNDFWKIDAQISRRIYSKLSKVMPILHSIVGNFLLTARTLEFLLEEHVEWKMEERIIHVNFSNNEVIKPLNNCDCGESLFTCGDYTVTTPTVVFSIGPIAGSEIADFLPGENKRNLINIFQNYFIPLEIESEYIFTISEINQEFSMDQSYLGFNTTIN
jgi:hypothetical protein